MVISLMEKKPEQVRQRVAGTEVLLEKIPFEQRS